MFDISEFLRTSWRQAPVFVRGGAAALLGKSWSYGDFDLFRAAVGRSEHARVHEVQGEVTFIERVSAVDPELGDKAADLGSKFGAPESWFDSVRT